MIDNDPNIVKIRRVPVGNMVVYHGRSGSMRQGRTSFPAVVLQQHPDDGSLDLIVEYEAEDRIWEQRVRPWSEQQPGHCWTFVEPIDLDPEVQSGLDQQIQQLRRAIDVLDDSVTAALDKADLLIKRLMKQMYGDYDPPSKSMIEYLDGFDKRIRELEKKLRK